MYTQHVFYTDTRTLSGEQYNTPAWWRVDLGAPYDVYKVLIVNRDQFKGICLTDRKDGNKDSSLMQRSK